MSFIDYSACQLLIEFQAIPILLSLFSSPDLKVVEASSRALKIILTNQKPVQPSFIQKVEFSLLLNSLYIKEDAQPINLRIAENVCCILARTASIVPTRDAISTLVEFLDTTYDFNPKLQEASLDALASLCRETHDVCQKVMTCTSSKYQLI